MKINIFLVLILIILTATTATALVQKPVLGPSSSTTGFIPAYADITGRQLSTGYELKTTVGTPGSDSKIVTEQGIREAITAFSSHDSVTISTEVDTFLGLSTQQLTLDTQTANKVFAGPTTGAAAAPTFRDLVADDIPDLSGAYLPLKTIGIADNNLVEVDGAEVATGEVAVFTANGLNGYDETEFKYTFNLESGIDYQTPLTEGSYPDRTVTNPDIKENTILAENLAPSLKSITQTVSMATGTLTPVAGQYKEYFLYITGTTTPYTQIALSESDATPLTIPDRALIHVINVGETPLYMIEIANQQQLAGGPIMINQNGGVKFRYYTDRYVQESPPVSSIEYLQGGNLSPFGIWQAAGKKITAAGGILLEASQMNSTVLHTAAGSNYFPANMCDDVDTTGAIVSLRVKQTGAFDVKWFSNDSADQFIFPDGTPTTAGNSLDTGGLIGNGFCIECLSNNKWYITSQTGTSAEGSAPAGFTAKDYFGGANADPLLDGDNDTGPYAYGGATYRASSFTVGSNYTMTKLAAKLSKTGTPNIDSYCYIYNIATGTNRPTGSPIATATHVINTQDVCDETDCPEWMEFLFDGIALATNGGTDGNGKYCMVLYGTGGVVGNYPMIADLNTDLNNTISISEYGTTWVNTDSTAQCTFKTYATTE